MWSSWWFGTDSPIRSLVDSSASRIHASFVFILLDAPLPQFFFYNFAGHSRSNWCFQFLTNILDGFLKFLILRVNEVDPSPFSCVFKMELFIRPLLLLLQLGVLSHFRPEFWLWMIWPGCKLFSRQSLPGPHLSAGYVHVLQWNREWFFSRRVMFDSGFNVMAVHEVSRHGPKIVYCFTGIPKRVVRWWKKPFWFSKKIKVTFSSNWVFPYRCGCSRVLVSSKGFDSSICDCKNKFSFFGNITSFALSLFE